MKHHAFNDTLRSQRFPFIYQNTTQQPVVLSSKEKVVEGRCTTASATILFERTLSDIEARFRKHRHVLNPAQLSSLVDAVEIMVAMANADMDAEVSLSSLDPGVGKTTTYIHFIQNLVSMEEYEDVGVLICLQRLDEVKRLVAELRLEPHSVCIKTSDPDINALAGAPVQEAQVLITTHEQIRRHSKRYERFTDISRLHYRGKSRKVRIWDEAYNPREVIQVSSDDIKALVVSLRSTCPSVAHKLEALVERLLNAPPGPFQVGEVFADFSASVMADVRAVVSERSTQETTLLRLLDLEDQTVRKADDNTSVATLHTWSQVIPSDFAPALVFDASGRVRSTYTALEQNGDLYRLPVAPKDYSTVNVHLYTIASSRTAWRENRRALVKQVSTIMAAKPNDRFLVVAHKDTGARKLGKDLEAAAPGVSFDILRWGQHQGTNAFAGFDHIIVASTFFLPEAAYEALAYASLGIKVTEPLPEGFLAELKRGEQADMLLQGICRGTLRGCVDGKAARCEVHILASARSRMQDLVPTIFPGSKLMRHTVHEAKASTAVNRAINYCNEHLTIPNAMIPVADLMEACGISHRSNFNKQVLRKKAFQDYMEAVGLRAIEGQRAGSVCGIKTPAFSPVETTAIPICV